MNKEVLYYTGDIYGPPFCLICTETFANTQSAFTCSKVTMETVEQSVEYIQK